MLNRPKSKENPEDLVEDALCVLRTLLKPARLRAHSPL